MTNPGIGISSKYTSVYSLGKRFLKFLIIGFGGLAINTVGLYLLTDKAHIYFVLAAFPAIQLSLLFTFYFNESWTWKERRYRTIGERYLKYQMVNGVGIGINISTLFLLTELLGTYYLLANIIGAAFAAIWNFSGNHFFTWSTNSPFSRKIVDIRKFFG